MILVAKAKWSLKRKNRLAKFKMQNAKCKMGFAPLRFAHKERVNICQNILVLKFELFRSCVRILKNTLVWMKTDGKIKNSRRECTWRT